MRPEERHANEVLSGIYSRVVVDFRLFKHGWTHEEHMQRAEGRSDAKTGSPLGRRRRRRKTPPVPNVVNLDKSSVCPDLTACSSKRDRTEIDVDEADVSLRNARSER